MINAIMHHTITDHCKIMELRIILIIKTNSNDLHYIQNGQFGLTKLFWIDAITIAKIFEFFEQN